MLFLGVVGECARLDEHRAGPGALKAFAEGSWLVLVGPAGHPVGHPLQRDGGHGGCQTAGPIANRVPGVAFIDGRRQKGKRHLVAIGSRPSAHILVVQVEPEGRLQPFTDLGQRPGLG